MIIVIALLILILISVVVGYVGRLFRPLAYPRARRSVSAARRTQTP